MTIVEGKKANLKTILTVFFFFLTYGLDENGGRTHLIEFLLFYSWDQKFPLQKLKILTYTADRFLSVIDFWEIFNQVIKNQSNHINWSAGYAT